MKQITINLCTFDVGFTDWLDGEVYLVATSFGSVEAARKVYFGSES